MWSAAYPLGVYGVACTQLAIDLDSPTFRVIASIVLVVSVLYWFYLVAFTLPLVISGELFLAEAKEDRENAKLREQEERRRSSPSGSRRDGQGSSSDHGSSSAA